MPFLKTFKKKLRALVFSSETPQQASTPRASSQEGDPEDAKAAYLKRKRSSTPVSPAAGKRQKLANEDSLAGSFFGGGSSSLDSDQAAPVQYQKFFPQSKTPSVKKEPKIKQEWDSEEEWEAEKALDDPFINPLISSPTDGKAQAAKDDTNVRPDEKYYDPDDFNFKYDAAVQKRNDEAEAMRSAGWSNDAIALYRTLSLRGYEPLLPLNWWLDFDTMPTALFAVGNEEPFIRAESGNEFRAVKALRSLVLLGPHVRDAVVTADRTPPKRKPEELIRREINAYSNWAYTDGGVDHKYDIPVMAIVTGAVTKSAYALEAELRKKLDILWNQWYDALIYAPDNDSEDASVKSGLSYDPPTEPELLAHIPTLYGVLISNTVVAFVVYERTDTDSSLREIATFNFREMDYDVWTSLAMAILVCHCRNKMMDMQKYLEQAISPGIVDDDPDK